MLPDSDPLLLDAVGTLFFEWGLPFVCHTLGTSFSFEFRSLQEWVLGCFLGMEKLRDFFFAMIAYRSSSDCPCLFGTFSEKKAGIEALENHS